MKRPDNPLPFEPDEGEEILWALHKPLPGGSTRLRVLLWCAAEVYRLPVDASAEITVTFDDSYFTDTESQRSRDLDEVKAGILTVEEYRRKWVEV